MTLLNRSIFEGQIRKFLKLDLSPKPSDGEKYQLRPNNDVGRIASRLALSTRRLSGLESAALVAAHTGSNCRSRKRFRLKLSSI